MNRLTSHTAQVDCYRPLKAENSIFTPFNQPGNVLEFFKRNHLFNSLLLLPYAFVIRSVVIIFPAARIEGLIFGTWGGDFIKNTHSWGAGEFILSTFIVFIQAAILNRLFIIKLPGISSA